MPLKRVTPLISRYINSYQSRVCGWQSQHASETGSYFPPPSFPSIPMNMKLVTTALVLQNWEVVAHRVIRHDLWNNLRLGGETIL